VLNINGNNKSEKKNSCNSLSGQEVGLNKKFSVN